MDIRIALLILGVLGSAICQDTARAVLASHLRECYSDRALLNRNNLPPATIPVLIDIIRKIEDYPGTVANMRQLSTGILHMFRQDGIVYDPESSGVGNVLPYSPTGFQTYKNRLLLTKLLPNNQFRFPNASLTSKEKCALHRMVSSTIETETRGDESTVCPLVSQIGPRRRRSNELLKINPDVEVFDVNGNVDPFGQQIIGTSNCPIESGVVSTTWGAIAVGPLISGIAASLEPQQVLITDLVRVKDDFVIDPTTRVNNVHSATVAGDLAEAAMRQGTSGRATTIGATGNWNSTNARRHYFLNRSDNLEVTDAEIRGGMDGLILGDLASSYETDIFQELKLSQLLEMYYSEKGTFHDPRFRACLRQTLITSVASTENLRQETFGFSIALYTTMPLEGTSTLGGVQNFVNNTVDSFYRYVAQSINDLACSVNSPEVLRPRINLILVTSPTMSRYPLISYLIEQIDVSTHGSSITLMDPLSGNTLIEKTHSLSQFHEEFANLEMLNAVGASLNLTSVLQSIRSMVSAGMVLETAAHYSGGNASAALFLVDNIPLDGNEQRDTNHLAALMRQQLPDLRLIFATSSAARDSLQFVLRDDADFIPLTLSSVSASAEELAPVVDRLRAIPRRIINPLCSTHWMDLNSGTATFEEFVDADGINLYSLHPNYFYTDNQARALRVQSATYGTVNVCYSRSDPFPRRNRTTSTAPPGVTCESVTAAGSLEMSLAGACDGYATIEECPPLYLTVSSTTSTSPPQCREVGCRLPNDLKYTVAIQQLGCYSCVGRLAYSQLLLIVVTLSYYLLVHRTLNE